MVRFMKKENDIIYNSKGFKTNFVVVKTYNKNELLSLSDEEAKDILPKNTKKNEIDFMWIIEEEKHHYKPYGRMRKNGRKK